MTSKDNIIYYTITRVVFIGIVMCFLLFHNSEQISNNSNANEKEQTMIDKINAFAPIINAITVLLSFGFVIWTTCFRKTRRDRIDELKVEVLETVSTVKGHEDWVRTKELSTAAENLSKVLGRKYHSKKWYDLLPVALVELRNEGYHQVLGISATPKTINQPLTMNPGQ